MILITVIKNDGSEGATYPSNKEDVNVVTEEFIKFLESNPIAGLGAKTAKIRRTVELEEISEITIPEPDMETLLSTAMEMLKSMPKPDK